MNISNSIPWLIFSALAALYLPLHFQELPARFDHLRRSIRVMILAGMAICLFAYYLTDVRANPITQGRWIS